LQAPPGRVANGEKIAVISFGTQQQQHQYRSVNIYITIIVIIITSSSSCSGGGGAGSLTINLIFWANTIVIIIFKDGKTKGDEMGETPNKQGDTNIWLETHKGIDYFEDV
jgi:hypothetical protein